MNQSKSIFCPVCKSVNHSYYISTHALMHKPNEECYTFNKCGSCESVFLTNRVEEKELGNYYTDHYLPYQGSAAWGKFSSFVEGSQRKLDSRRVDFIANLKRSNKEFSILDVGCGKPSFLDLVQRRLNAECTGIDFSDNGWKNDSYENIELLKTTFAQFETGRLFDIITLWHYLEHDYNLPETVNKLYNCLKPGGKLVIEVPDYMSISAKWQKTYWQGWHSPRHLSLFSKKGFQALFTDDKWKISKHLRYGTLDAFTLWWLGKMEEKKINWSASMEKEFWPLVFLKVISFPFFLFEKVFPMGIQLIVIEKK
ncbi:MAG: class I SAM-dependent methyltransferase [Chitinophagaceae bacterium]|nr:MAG: class I SAM-dependent methyltransferase [Chitinophagaceae bacterium]